MISFSNGGLLVSSLILLVSYIFIATEKIPKVTVAMIGASLTLLFGLITPGHVFHYIDFNVIFLLVSMMIVVNIASYSGMFHWMAIEILKKTKGKPLVVLFALAAITAVASAFLDNVTTVILILPVTFFIAKELGLDPVPFLITEILASNIGGAATLIGDPPNLIIASKAGFTFLDFLKELADIVTLIFFVCTGILMLMFKKELVASPEKMAQVEHLDNSKTIKDKPLMIKSSIVLFLVIIGFLLHDFLHIESYVCAMAGASVLLLFENPKTILHGVKWTTIFFFVGLFIIIGGFEENGGISLLANKLIHLTKGDLTATSMIIIWGSGIFSAIVDNIPYTATMAPIIAELGKNGIANLNPLWWSLALGACLGGNATIIGAAANVVVSETAAENNCHISFMRFLKYGVLITFVSLVMSSIYIYFKFLR